jgi:putative ABC transport system ATP-binding protein
VLDRFLCVEDVSVNFGTGEARIRALRKMSIGFARGSLSLVMGPSGSGKTTLLSLIGCLLSPDEGNVYVEGMAVNTLGDKARTAIRQTKISFVFQAFRLFHSLSVIDNVALPFELRGSKQPAQIATARDLLGQFGLGHKLSHEPKQLSPGEKQRVAVARALVGNPAILLADEPTASLDADAGRNICQILRNQVDQNGRTVVIVSHDPRWKEFADRTVLLSDGQLDRSDPVTAS